MNSQLLIAIFTVVGAGIGYLIKYFLDKKRDFNSENIKVKREMYKNFIVLILKSMNNTKKDNKGNLIPLDMKNELNKFYEYYMLYSSPNVINAFAEFMQYVYKNPTLSDTKITFRKLGKVIKSMRNEVGLSSRGLGSDGEKIFRAMFTDFDELIK